MELTTTNTGASVSRQGQHQCGEIRKNTEITETHRAEIHPHSYSEGFNDENSQNKVQILLNQTEVGGERPTYT